MMMMMMACHQRRRKRQQHLTFEIIICLVVFLSEQHPVAYCMALSPSSYSGLRHYMTGTVTLPGETAIQCDYHIRDAILEGTVGT